MVLDVIAGPDSNDSTCIPSGSAGGSERGGGGFASALLGAGAQNEGGAIPGSLEGVTVGIPREFNVEELGETREVRRGGGAGGGQGGGLC